VLEFPQLGRQCAKAITLWQANADADLIVIERCDGPQP